MLGFVCKLLGDVCSAGDFLGSLEPRGERCEFPVSVPRAMRTDPVLESRPCSRQGPSPSVTPSIPSVGEEEAGGLPGESRNSVRARFSLDKQRLRVYWVPGGMQW